MPETLKGRQAISDYLDQNDISVRSLAKMFGLSHEYVRKVLNGENTGPSANKLILKIIDALKI